MSGRRPGRNHHGGRQGLSGESGAWTLSATDPTRIRRAGGVFTRLNPADGPDLDPPRCEPERLGTHRASPPAPGEHSGLAGRRRGAPSLGRARRPGVSGRPVRRPRPASPRPNACSLCQRRRFLPEPAGALPAGLRGSDLQRCEAGNPRPSLYATGATDDRQNAALVGRDFQPFSLTVIAQARTRHLSTPPGHGLTDGRPPNDNPRQGR